MSQGPVLHSWRERTFLAAGIAGVALGAFGSAFAALAAGAPGSFWLWWAPPLVLSFAFVAASPQLLRSVPDDRVGSPTELVAHNQILTRSAPTGTTTGQRFSFTAMGRSGRSDTSERMGDWQETPVPELSSEQPIT
jgi:hypothetical protein